MADRHRTGMEAAIDRLEQVREELECHAHALKDVVTREIEKVKRKQLKIVKKLTRA